MSCTSSKSLFNPENSEKIFLTFGTGGGFTGGVVKYYLLDDGTIYSKIGDEIIKVGKVPKQATTQVFANYEKLGLHNVSLNEPGNRYSFIEKSNRKEKHTIMWGKKPLENTNLDVYLSVLMNIVRKVKSSETF